MIRFTSVAFVLLLTTQVVDAASVERDLSITLTVDGSQNWQNAQQWSKATTQQRYELATRLHSDGRLYHDNLLDPNQEQRVRIKTEYYTYRGLLELRQEFGGKLPTYADVEHRISGDNPEVLQARAQCVDAADCPNAVAERFAAINALQSNTPAELEAFIATYDEPGGRYLYFSGIDGCTNRIKLSHRSHFEGVQAFDRDKKKLQPFTLDWSGEGAGNASDQHSLCERYVVTVDTSNGDISVENVYLPVPRGSVVHSVGGVRDARDADLPAPSEVMRWANDRLRKAPDHGNVNASLHLTQPLDGNATVLGLFDGNAKVELTWSFTKAAAPKSPVK
jgi:hypothetical protein